MADSNKWPETKNSARKCR